MTIIDFAAEVACAAGYWLYCHTDPWGWLEANNEYLSYYREQIDTEKKDPDEDDTEIWEEIVFPALVVNEYRYQYPHFDDIVFQCEEVVNVLTGGDPFEAAVVLLRANSLLHCGGVLLSEYGNIPFSFVDEVSQKGLENVFGQEQLDEFFTDYSKIVSFIEEAMGRY